MDRIEDNTTVTGLVKAFERALEVEKLIRRIWNAIWANKDLLYLDAKGQPRAESTIVLEKLKESLDVRMLRGWPGTWMAHAPFPHMLISTVEQMKSNDALFEQLADLFGPFDDRLGKELLDDINEMR